MQAYRVEGTFPNGPQRQPYTLDVVASDEADALHRVLSLLGSRHRVARQAVVVDSVGTIEAGESNEPAVVAHFKQ